MTRTPLLLACAAALAATLPAARAADLPFEFSPTANVQYEWTQVDTDTAAPDGEHGFRRGRLGFRLQGKDKHWQFVAEHDFADRTPADAYLEWTPAEGHALRVGQFKQAFTLEDANSDKQTAFLEPSFVGLFAISRRVGAEYARYGKSGTLNVALFDQRVDGTNDSHGATARGTWVLHAGADGVVHVGASLASESPRTGSASFSANPGTVFTSVRVASTGSIAGVERLDRAAIEGLWLHGPWSLQAETAQVRARRDAAADFRGNASSVLLTWSPNGARTYKRGVAAAPVPKGHAIWEFGLRWSAIDLDDAGVAGGHADSVGVAATCYVNRNLRVIGDVLRVDSNRRGVETSPVVAGVRLQFTY
ncbi:MAG: OprO/OprP family phosphate-selective porin [Lysobacteraceae bacterium]